MNAKATIDADGFGGHTPFFHTVVTLAAPDNSKARLLLSAGDPTPGQRSGNSSGIRAIPRRRRCVSSTTSHRLATRAVPGTHWVNGPAIAAIVARWYGIRPRCEGPVTNFQPLQNLPRFHLATTLPPIATANARIRMGRKGFAVRTRPTTPKSIDPRLLQSIGPKWRRAKWWRESSAFSRPPVERRQMPTGRARRHTDSSGGIRPAPVSTFSRSMPIRLSTRHGTPGRATRQKVGVQRSHGIPRSRTHRHARSATTWVSRNREVVKLLTCVCSEPVCPGR